MSLIEEALRRAQETTQPAKSDTPPVEHVRPRTEENAHPATVYWWRMPTFLGLVFLLIAGIIGWELWLYLIPMRVPPLRAARENHQAVTKVDPAAVTQRSLRHHLELNGIVEGAGEPLAIINGQIVRVGEIIDGATLVDVGHNTARLRRHGQDVVLQTAR